MKQQDLGVLGVPCCRLGKIPTTPVTAEAHPHRPRSSISIEFFTISSILKFPTPKNICCLTGWMNGSRSSARIQERKISRRETEKEKELCQR
ncbi:hypothetical protein C1H46_039457 [Malus baccata]|uniref:Uncharacterized protein n=1 Tax=Malus baccata TaxID=106549 RepID=A0A540KLE5_MALBA|nr:hypothetical protein C1H46_039457 [Malus baccata]